jgi:hypothetical protein
MEILICILVLSIFYLILFLLEKKWKNQSLKNPMKVPRNQGEIIYFLKTKGAMMLIRHDSFFNPFKDRWYLKESFMENIICDNNSRYYFKENELLIKEYYKVLQIIDGEPCGYWEIEKEIPIPTQ